MSEKSKKIKIAQFRRLVQKRRQAESSAEWSQRDQLNLLRSVKDMQGLGVTSTMLAAEGSLKKKLQTALGNHAFSNDFLDFLVKTMPRKTIEAHFDFMPSGMKRSSTGQIKDEDDEGDYPPMAPQKKTDQTQRKKKKKEKKKKK